VNASTDSIARSQPLVMRVLVRRVVYRHPRFWGSVCLAAGAWLVFLGLALLAVGGSWRAGFWWGPPLIAIGTLETWIAIRLLHVARS
jgi:hypothetical protein